MYSGANVRNIANKFNNPNGYNHNQPPPNPYQKFSNGYHKLFNGNNNNPQQPPPQQPPPPNYGYNQYNPQFNGNNNPMNNMNNGHMNGMKQQMNGYKPQYQMPQQPPPNVGYGIDDNPYSMDDMDIYDQHGAESDDSSGDQNNGSDQPLSSNQQVDLIFETPQIGSFQDSILPDIPEFPDMIQPKEMDLKPEEEKLHRHCGFVIKLNSRLLALHAEVRQVYPQLAKDLVDTKLASFQDEEYKNCVDEKVNLKNKCSEYEQQIQMLLPAQSLNNDLNSEILKLRELVSTYSSKQQQQQKYQNDDEKHDYRSMIDEKSRNYVNEIEKQLKIYREKVIFLSNNQESCLAEIKKSIAQQQSTQENLQSAYDELKPLQEHLAFLEENQNEQYAELDRVKSEFESFKEMDNKKFKEMEFQKKNLQNELDILKQQHENAKSEKMANTEQIVHNITVKYKAQVEELEDSLSKMKITHLTMEDDFAQRQKQEQERADKYRAKYESVKQHVKTLEMQKTEYTRVNNELRAQNNQFRGMITQLQNQLKMISMQGQRGGGNGGGGNGMPPMGQQAALQQRLMHMQQQQNILQKQRQAQQQQQQQGQQGMNQYNAPQSDDNDLIPQRHQQLWGKSTKTISQKGTKKRVLIEWHFVTSDRMPHTVVLQHTQDQKPKTRRMLWVDGSEKYNNKSSASSFRIEIDKDVVVVTIDQMESYQYRLTINNAAYSDAFKLWEKRQERG